MHKNSQWEHITSDIKMLEAKALYSNLKSVTYSKTITLSLSVTLIPVGAGEVSLITLPAQQLAK